MTGARVTVVGADRVEATMHEFADELRDLGDAHARAGALIARTAAGNVRRRTGALAASIDVRVSAQGPTITAGAGGVRYAGPIEGGWRAHGIEPQRFMRRALDTESGRVVETYVQEIDKQAHKIRGA